MRTQRPIPMFLTVILGTPILVASLTNQLAAQRPGPSLASQAIVTLTNGQQIRRGTVDRRTSDQHLWLRFGGGHATIRRRIDWPEAQLIRLGDHAISQQQLMVLLREPTNSSPSVPEPTPQRSSNSSGTASSPHQSPHDEPIMPRSAKRPGGKITQLRFDAYLANWDRDVESDGLTVNLQPADASGRIVPVNGTLRVELFAEKHVRYHQVNRERGLQLQRVSVWSRPIDASEFSADGLTVSLRFQTAHPELDSGWSPHGLVHAALTAPGHGVFERSIDGIRIRPFAPLRDALERQSGRRFLPTELVGSAEKGSR